MSPKSSVPQAASLVSQVLMSDMAGYGRSTAMAQQALVWTQSSDLRSQLAGLQRQLDALGDPKPVDAADADLKRHASSSVWAQANNCNLPVPGGFQRFCAEYQRLMSALAASQSATELQGKMEALRVEIAEATTVDAVRPPNPAWEAIERVTGWRMGEVTTVWALVLMLMLEAFSATIPSAMLRTFPRGQAPLPDRARDTHASVPAEVAQTLPESLPNFLDDNAPLPPKPRGEMSSTRRLKRSPKPSPKPADANSGRPRFAVVERSPSTSQPSPTFRNIFQQGDLPTFLATLPIEPGREMRFSSLREAHKKWAVTVGRPATTDTSLGMALRAAGFVARKTGGVMVYRNCRHPAAKSA